MVRAWTVRGGRYGEREQAALEEGLIILGWENLGDLSVATSVDELSSLVQKAYRDAAPRTIDNWTHQLWRFVNVMRVDDLVVMPQKYKPVIAIGRVAGEYRFRAEAPEEFRHVRRVEWLKTEVERAVVGADLRDSMGSFLTVSELSRRDAVARVESLATRGTDPGYSGYVPPPADLSALKSEVDEAGMRQLSVRDLIGLWTWKRRTTDAIDLVDQGLADLGLTVEPHFTAVQLDDLVTVSSLDSGESEELDADSTSPARNLVAAASSDDGTVGKDLTWRIGNLKLVRKVVTVQAHQPLGTAIEKMVAGDYSQLPVVEEHGRLTGIVTWESIAHAQLMHAPKSVASAMSRNPPTGREGEELFARIGDIQRRGYLIVVDEENVVTGILTAADLAGELRTRVHPFMVLEEIERRLRRALSGLSAEELVATFPKNHPQAKKVKSSRDLTMGNYSFVLNDERCWAKLAWPYERTDMVDHLRSVAEYRNDMAHWNVDAPDDDSEELIHANRVLKLLKIIDRDPA